MHGGEVYKSLGRGREKEKREGEGQEKRGQEGKEEEGGGRKEAASHFRCSIRTRSSRDSILSHFFIFIPFIRASEWVDG